MMASQMAASGARFMGGYIEGHMVALYMGLYPGYVRLLFVFSISTLICCKAQAHQLEPSFVPET